MQAISSEACSASAASVRRYGKSSLVLRGGAVLGSMAFMVFACNAQPIAAYKLQPGDSVEISVAGLPELRQSVSVQPDGTIAFPLLGALKVAGLSPDDMRQEVQAHLARKIYRQRTNDGREILIVIRPEEVSATIVGYRPIYVSGDVAKPGELTFRPGITVRQVLALAGGYDRPTANELASYLEAASVKGEYQTLWLDFARERARIARVRSELKDQENIKIAEGSDIPLSPPKLAQMNEFETDLLKARLAGYRSEKDFLQATVNQADEQTEVLDKLQKEEEQGAQSDTEDLQKLVMLLNRGQVTNARVTDARRAVLLSSTRVLQVTAQLLKLKKEKMDSLHQLEHFDDDRRIALLKDLADATQALNVTRMKLGSSEEKLAYISKVRSQLLVDKDRSPEITLVRRNKNGVAHTSVDMDFALAPGDVIDVLLHPKGTNAVVSR